MALDQNEVNNLIKLKEKIELAKTAREKVFEMYKAVIGIPCLEELKTLPSISMTINEISRLITEDSIYYPSFMKLQVSYYEKMNEIKEKNEMKEQQ